MSDNRVADRILRNSAFGFGEEDEEEDYQPWRSCNAGEVMHIELVMPDRSSEFFSYMQKFSMDLNEQHTSLVLEGAEERVSIEGNGLRQLAQQITRRRIKSIHVGDETKHDEQDSSEDIVTRITVEQSS